MSFSDLVTQAGGEYVGVQDGLVYFHDPETKSTLCVHVRELNEAAIAVDVIRARLARSREEFSKQERKCQR